jgi:hypothetical protein
VADRSFGGVFSKYGFEERLVDMSEPMDAAAASQFWKEFTEAIDRLLKDGAMHERLARISAHMRSQDGRRKAARLIDDLMAREEKS